MSGILMGKYGITAILLTKPQRLGIGKSVFIIPSPKGSFSFATAEAVAVLPAANFCRSLLIICLASCSLCFLCLCPEMSAEAADREAATGSRPCTPPQTSWFEFLLDETLLEQHLQGSSPGKLDSFVS